MKRFMSIALFCAAGPASAQYMLTPKTEYLIRTYETCVMTLAEPLLVSGEAARELVRASKGKCNEQRLRISMGVIDDIAAQYPKLTFEQRTPIIKHVNETFDGELDDRMIFLLIQKKAALRK